MAVLDQVRLGPSAVFLVAGEAGIGKTRFLREVASRARGSGFRVLEGGCVHLGGEPPPFGPLVEALRGLSDELSPVRLDELMGTGRSDLARVMPGLRHTGLSRADADAIGPERMFEQVLLFLNRLARVAPILLVIEDIHWADRSSLDLLAYLVRNLRSSIALVASYRSDDLHRRHPLLPVIAGFERSGRVERIALLRLDRDEIAEQLLGILGHDPDEDVLEEIYARSQGNAFYAEELLAAGAHEGGLPETLREVLLERFAALSDAAQELVRVASAAGPRIHVPLLAAVIATEEMALDAGLREAVASQILVSKPTADDHEYAFRHALVQEAVYAELLPGERTRLHAAFAHALSNQTQPEGDLWRTAELAYHWHAAHDLPQAFEASVRAGLAADAMFGSADALANYERALELWDQVPDAAARSPVDRVELLVLAAQDARLATPSRAIAYVRAAADLVDPVVDPARAGLVHSFLGLLLFHLDDERALAALREAVDLVPADPPSATRARVLIALGGMLAEIDRHTESMAVLHDAIRVARLAGTQPSPQRPLEALGLDVVVPRRIELAAIEQLGVDLAALGDVEAGVTSIVAARAMATDLGLPGRTAETWHWHTAVLLESARFEEAVAVGLEGAAYHERHSAVGKFDPSFTADALFALGRWDDAARSIGPEQRRRASAGNAPFLELRQALLDVARGDFIGASRRLGHQRMRADQTLFPRVLGPYVAAHAELALWKGDPIAARDVVLAGLPRIEATREAWIGHLGPVYALGIRAEADLATRARVRQDGAALREAHEVAVGLLDRIRGLAEEIAAQRPVYSQQAEAWLATCTAEMARLDGAADPNRWATAAEAWGALQMPYPRAYSLMREGQAALAGPRDRARAAAAVRAASILVEPLAARPLLRTLEELAERADVRLGPEEAETDRASSRPAVRVRRNGERRRYELTRRELEVLGLLAAGRSDGDIASQLFISKKTVSVHVANIKGKLGAGSRVEIVTSALGLGLLEGLSSRTS